MPDRRIVRPPLRVCLAAALLVLLAVLPVGSRAAAAGPCPPASVRAPTPGAAVEPATTPPQPEALLACVGATPITGALYAHWFSVAGKAGSAAQPEQVREEVMSFLVSSYWVIGEAAASGVHVSAALVRRTFDRIRAQQFPHRGEFAHFLHSSGQTLADLLFRVQLNLLSQRLQSRIVAGLHSARARQRALRRFVVAFKERWRPQTSCQPSYAVSDCGQVGTL
jgi:hypothetical protein